jgi:hypothetical protein
VTPARDRERHPQIGDGEGVEDELAAGLVVLAGPVDVGVFETVLDLEKLGAAATKAIDQRRAATAADIIFELRAGPVEEAGVIERSQPLADLLRRATDKLKEMGRPQEAMAGDLADDLDIAGGDMEGRRSFRALEARTPAPQV